MHRLPRCAALVGALVLASPLATAKPVNPTEGVPGLEAQLVRLQESVNVLQASVDALQENVSDIEEATPDAFDVSANICFTLYGTLNANALSVAANGVLKAGISTGVDIYGVLDIDAGGELNANAGLGLALNAGSTVAVNICINGTVFKATQEDTDEALLAIIEQLETLGVTLRDEAPAVLDQLEMTPDRVLAGYDTLVGLAGDSFEPKDLLDPNTYLDVARNLPFGAAAEDRVAAVYGVLSGANGLCDALQAGAALDIDADVLDAIETACSTATGFTVSTAVSIVNNIQKVTFVADFLTNTVGPTLQNAFNTVVSTLNVVNNVNAVVNAIKSVVDDIKSIANSIENALP